MVPVFTVQASSIKSIYKTHIACESASLRSCLLLFFASPSSSSFAHAASLSLSSVSQSINQPLSRSLTEPPFSKSTPLDPKSVTAFLSNTHSLFPACHSQFCYAYRCVCMCVCVCVSLTVPARPCTCVSVCVCLR